MLCEGNIAIIAPCKGVDPEFSAFLQALTRQKSAHYTVYFVVANGQDAAVPLIKELLTEKPHLGELVTFPPPAGFSGKIANMVGGIRAAWRDQADFVVFLDSDTIPDPAFISSLITPLVRGEALLTTGARILTPRTGSTAQWVASLWMQSSLPGVTQPQLGSAWGGAMAIRADDAKRLDVESLWRDAFSDDHTLSRAVRRDGGVIQFVPNCLITVPIDYTWTGALDFIVRQLVTIRVHDARLWYVAWIMIYPLFLILVGLSQIAWVSGLWGSATLAAFIPLALSYYWVNGTVRKQIGLDRIHLSRQPLIRQLAILAALIAIHPLAMLRSAMLRHFVWRGRTYEIRRGAITIIADGDP